MPRCDVGQLPRDGPLILRAYKAYDTQAFVETLPSQVVTPHVAQNTARAGGSAIYARTSRHESYAAILVIRKLIEIRISWVKEIGGMRKVSCAGLRESLELLLSLTPSTCCICAMC